MLVQWPRYRSLRVEENVELSVGKGCAFNGMTIQNDGARKSLPRVKVSIGCHFHCGKGCTIRTSDHDFANGYPMVHGDLSGYRCAGVTIGDYVWFGHGVLVMKGVTIGDGAVIQAQSVVVSDIPRLAIAGGHPCRPFAFREEEEYEFFRSLNLTRLPKDESEAAEAKRDFQKRLDDFRARTQSGRQR